MSVGIVGQASVVFLINIDTPKVTTGCQRPSAKSSHEDMYY